MGAAAGVSAALNTASAEELASVMSSISDEAKEKIHTALRTPGKIIKHPYANAGEEHRLYLPKSYDLSKKYPVIVALHGAGGIGNHHHASRQGLLSVLAGPRPEHKALYALAASHGVPIEKEEQAIAKDFGFIVILAMATPRVLYDDWTIGKEKFEKGMEHYSGDKVNFEEVTHLTGHVEKTNFGTFVPGQHHWECFRPRVFELLDMTLANLGGDASRVYLCGMSAGGKGVLEFAVHAPERFAAVVAACAYYGKYPGPGKVCEPMEDDAIEALTGMPLWLFHGKKDAIVDFENGRMIVEAMRKANGEKAADIVKFTEYEECPSGGSPMTQDPNMAAGHGSFEYAFRNPEVYCWLLQFQKNAT